MRNLILVTGGNGRFVQTLKKKVNFNFKFLTKKELNILKPNLIDKCLLKYKPKMLIHTAGLSRPMQQHNKDIINFNIKVSLF